MKRALFFIFFYFPLEAAERLEHPYYHEGPSIIKIKDSSLVNATHLADEETVVLTELEGVVFGFGGHLCDLYEGPRSRHLFNTLKVKSKGLFGLTSCSTTCSEGLVAHLKSNDLYPTKIYRFYDGQTLAANADRGYSVWELGTVYASGVLFAGKGHKGTALLSFLHKAGLKIPKKFLVIDYSTARLKEVEEIFQGDSEAVKEYSKYSEIIRNLRRQVKEVVLYEMNDDE